MADQWSTRKALNGILLGVQERSQRTAFFWSVLPVPVAPSLQDRCSRAKIAVTGTVVSTGYTLVDELMAMALPPRRIRTILITC